MQKGDRIPVPFPYPILRPRRFTLLPAFRLGRMLGRRIRMIQLTQEQVQALGNSGAFPPRVVNPQTQEMFVLVPLAEYERHGNDKEYDDDPWTDAERDRLRWEACQMLDSFGKDA